MAPTPSSSIPRVAPAGSGWGPSGSGSVSSRMRVTVMVGNEKLRIPVDEGSKTMAWLQAEIIRRWEKNHKGEYLHIRELRTADNVRLDNEDQVMAVCRADETLVVVLGMGNEPEVGPGDMIHQYYLSKLIGEGTYGRVYAAQDLNLQRPVAVKVLRREKANEVNTRRFLREAALNGSLSSSPFLVTVHDFGRTRGGTLFIVMELLKGRPLNELLDDRIANNTPFSVLECIHLMAPVLRGLHAAHTHSPSIVHRDLKPDNIWVNDVSGYEHSPRPMDHLTKIMDFGIAVHDEITHETLACGTRMYSSPEQTRRKAKLDGRSDIWSCGVILYQLLCLVVDVPFDPVDLLLNKQSVPPLRMYARTTPLSASMEAIVMRALEVDPALRFQSAEEMGDALHAEEVRLLDPSNTSASGRRAAQEAFDSEVAVANKAAKVASAVAPAELGTVAPAAAAAAASAAAAVPAAPTPPATPAAASAASTATKIAAASADSEPIHPRYKRRGMAFSSGDPPPPDTVAPPAPLLSKL